jgi:AcrR family transcriptional regulator
MGRPATIKDEALLDAAREVFLERGLAATTSDVAQRAGVSEGTLFKRFGSKTRLFQCAMSAETDTSGLVEAVAYGARGKPVEVLFEELGLALLAKFQRIVPVVLTHLVGTLEQGNPALPSFVMDVPPPLRMLVAVEGLLTALRDDGRIDEVDVPILSRMFVGSIWQFVFLDFAMKRFFGGREAHPMTPEDYVRGHVRIMLAGVRRRPGRAAPVRREARKANPKKAKRGMNE